MNYTPSKVIVDAQVVAQTRSYNPHITLNPAVHVKTASASYDRLLDDGPLTNRKIHNYMLLGKYGDQAKRVAQEREQLKARRKEARGTPKRKVNLDEYY